MDARAFQTEYGARAFFGRTAQVVRDMHRAEGIVIAGVDSIAPRRADMRRCKGETGDPTMSAALFKAEVATRIYADACARYTESVAWIGDALHLLNGVRLALGTGYAACLELRYIDGLEWREVAKETGCTPRHARRMRDTACEWVDTVGWVNACAGVGVA